MLSAYIVFEWIKTLLENFENRTSSMLWTKHVAWRGLGNMGCSKEIR